MNINFFDTIFSKVENGIKISEIFKFLLNTEFDYYDCKTLSLLMYL